MSRRRGAPVADPTLPFRRPPKPDQEKTPFRFIDLFAGIGGFRIGLQRCGGTCVFTSERDPHCQATYEKWFSDRFLTSDELSGLDSYPDGLCVGDINDVDPGMIPDHDLLTGGFPCQPFSLAGVSKKTSLGQSHGFDCERQGNLFFRICDIVEVKRPPILLLENVKNLLSHDGGKTWRIIREELDRLEYRVDHRVLDAQPWVPQHRERVFIVAMDRDRFPNSDVFSFDWVNVPSTQPVLRSILEEKPDSKYVLTDHLWTYLRAYAEKHRRRGNGFGFGLADLDGVTRTLSARYHKDGAEILIPRGPRSNPRRLTIVESARLMGFQSKVRARTSVPVSDTQAYRQFGNAVVPAVVQAVGMALTPALRQLSGVTVRDVAV